MKVLSGSFESQRKKFRKVMLKIGKVLSKGDRAKRGRKTETLLGVGADGLQLNVIVLYYDLLILLEAKKLAQKPSC